MLNQDWAADVRKYVPDADDAIIAGIVRYCGIALRKVDSSLVSFSDPKETARVRDGYCRKKLGLTDSDEVVDAAIAAVGERMKADRTKNRVTVYYLLAEHFGKLSVFAGKTRGGAGAAAAGAGVAAAAAGAAATVSAEPAAAAPPVAPAPAAQPEPAPPPEPVAEVAPAPLMSAAVGGAGESSAAGVAAVGAAAAGAAGAAAMATTATAHSSDHDRKAAAGWTQPVAREPSGGFLFGSVAAVIGLIIGAALLAWFISSRMGGDGEAAAPVVAAAPAPAPAPAPVEQPPAPPEGAGVVASEVAGRPMVSVYFDSGSALISADFAAIAAPIKAWLDANPGDMAQISGFNDPTGNAEFNADLARRRAEGVAAELRRMGVPEQQIDLEPPASATDTTTDLAGARRVEITVVPLS